MPIKPIKSLPVRWVNATVSSLRKDAFKRGADRRSEGRRGGGGGKKEGMKGKRGGDEEGIEGEDE